jgi:hypothetical protein
VKHTSTRTLFDEKVNNDFVSYCRTGRTTNVSRTKTGDPATIKHKSALKNGLPFPTKARYGMRTTQENNMKIK